MAQAPGAQAMMARDQASRGLGIELVDYAEGRAVTRMTVRPGMVNGHAVAHGGLIFSLLGRIPERGEVVRHPSGVEFEVLDVDPRRIRRLRVRPPTSSRSAA